MFERYTERARRVVFFARYEASQTGSMTIETEHFLLGLLREDQNLTTRLLKVPAAEVRDEVMRQIQIGERVPTSFDLPLSEECRRILAYAAEEAERLNHRHIGTEHLLLGLLREEKCTAAQVLLQRGLKLEAMRDYMARSSMPESPSEGIRGKIEGFGATMRQRLFPFTHNPVLPAAGVVPDADTAKRIAEAVWTPVYGVETVAAQQPLTAELRHNVWIVSGSAPAETSLFVFILRNNGSVFSLGRGPSGTDS